jgi:beta-glucanase (GH16 family)
MSFFVSLDKLPTSAVTFSYATRDGTAVASKDYEETSGMVVLTASQISTFIEVPIKGDATDLRQANLNFTLLISNPKDCILTNNTGKGTIITEDGTYLPTDDTGYSTPLTYPGFNLTWSDEFAAPALDKNSWNQEIGNGSNGWGNNELEFYTASTANTFLSDGKLIIEARKDNISGYKYSSGRMTTKTKKEFKFGRIDIRAKLPVGKGIWPALWMLGSNINSVGWPLCGEIDIMELVGTFPNKIHGTLHWKPTIGTNTNKGNSISLPTGDFSQKFHVFSILWEQDTIKWYLDDELFFTLTSSNFNNDFYPFNAPQFFIFNVAVGGDWPGPPDDFTAFPQRMFVDYIRVFQR